MSKIICHCNGDAAVDQFLMAAQKATLILSRKLWQNLFNPN
jgi:predicted amidohydrolase YtcJ